jgi:hypothetical protein
LNPRPPPCESLTGQEALASYQARRPAQIRLFVPPIKKGPGQLIVKASWAIADLESLFVDSGVRGDDSSVRFVGPGSSTLRWLRRMSVRRTSRGPPFTLPPRPGIRRPVKATDCHAEGLLPIAGDLRMRDGETRGRLENRDGDGRGRDASPGRNLAAPVQEES